MQRVTITLEDSLNAAFDAFRGRHGYHNRSEAIRDLIRERLDGERLAHDAEGECLAHLTYVYNHRTRALASRLTEAQHAEHDMILATLHVHLDHDHCLETAILRGPAERVRGFANALIAQPGVWHGRLHLLPLVAGGPEHRHGEDGCAHRHWRPETASSPEGSEGSE